MVRDVGIALVGYLVLCVVFSAGVFLGVAVVDDPPFRVGGGGLTGLWIVTIWVVTIVASLVAGWVCVRLGRQRRPASVLAGLLVAIVLISLIADAVFGPIPDGRTVVEALFGQVPESPLLEKLWAGRPQVWASVVTYTIAVAGVVAGGRMAEGHLEPDQHSA